MKIFLNFIFTLIILIFIFNKDTQNRDNNNSSKAHKKNITYALHLNAKTPYEVFVDDIPLPGFGRFYQSGMNTTLELNPYLLSNGEHKIKIRFLPLKSSKDSLLHPRDLYSHKDSKWNIYFVNYVKNNEAPLGYEGEINYKDSELKILLPKTPVPFWEQEFIINTDKLPYSLTGWSKSENLNEIDEDILKNEVFNFYSELREVMNNGNFDKYVEMNSKNDQEHIIATYDNDQDWYQSNERKQEFLNNCKNNMLPINKEDYQVKIYANGKIASIERILSFKNSSLVAKKSLESGKNKYYAYSFKIHKPLGSNKFEIIRK